jgi:hypothetical protein
MKHGSEKQRLFLLDYDVALVEEWAFFELARAC